MAAVLDDNARIEADAKHSERLVVIGMSEEARLLFVVCAELHDDVVRIIAARRASPSQRKRYAQAR
jgi:uncharacterized DUF497 family protein